jgi:hypothetical protein
MEPATGNLPMPWRLWHADASAPGVYAVTALAEDPADPLGNDPEAAAP